MFKLWVGSIFVGLLLLARPVAAQGAQVQWTQPNPVASAQTFVYTWKVDAAQAGPLTATCTGDAVSAACTASIPNVTAGSHTYVLQACSTTSCAAASLSTTPANTPGTPGGVKIIIIIQQGDEED